MTIHKAGPTHIGKPKWLKTKIPTGQTYFEIKSDLRERKLATVCEEAKCPNIGECWNTRTATFMILGDTCTRACRFCHVKTGNPAGWLDPEEPAQVAASAAKMKLEYVVMTMVDRDDLPDGGAAHVARTVTALRERNPGIKVELLVGDFRGSTQAMNVILATRPEVYAHNIETVARLSPRVRDARANYTQSLRVLQEAKQQAGYPVLTKSALMLGLGETAPEIEQALDDLRAHGVDLLTIGQYMRPTKRHLAVKEWVPPEQFEHWGNLARTKGFLGVASAPLVRSSYRAKEFYLSAMDQIHASRQTIPTAL
ncbi:MAG: lipoyl synthase [Zetaproteobacteria bacterium]|nr:lipoyl synthase [Zetaproteobacteria bacterium]